MKSNQFECKNLNWFFSLFRNLDSQMEQMEHWYWFGFFMVFCSLQDRVLWNWWNIEDRVAGGV